MFPQPTASIETVQRKILLNFIIEIPPRPVRISDLPECLSLIGTRSSRFQHI
jgi:hypothetical protein